MSRLRLAVAALLLAVLPVQSYAMAGMLACADDPAMQISQQAGSDHHAMSGGNAAAQDDSDCHRSAHAEHGSVKCSLCAMCAATLVSVPVAVAAWPVRVPQPAGIFAGAPQRIPEIPLAVPISAA